MLSETVADALSESGPLARSQRSFTVRPGQLEMASAVAEALEHDGVLVVEAGTGTGKTYAYLVPALLADRRVIISTGTRTLQDQLYERDLPAVMAALGVAPRVAVLKGRSNYVCHHHLERHLSIGRFESRREAATMQLVARFAAISETGDLAQAPGIPEDSSVWRLATSTRENCLGQDCPHLDRCFVYRARRKAMQADLVIVNHHLFCADLAMRDEGVSELLPQTQAVVFDEAHQLSEVATTFFGQTFGSRQVVDFAGDLMRCGREDAPESADWIGLSQGLESALRQARLAAGDTGRRDVVALRSRAAEAWMAALVDLDRAMSEAGAALLGAHERSRDLLRLLIRCHGLRVRLREWLARVSGAWLDAPHSPEPPVLAALEGSPGLGGEAATGTADAGASSDVYGATEADEGRSLPSVAWAEVHRQGFTLHLTPIEIGPVFRRQIEGRPMAWIFTSATLDAGDDFAHFRGALDLHDARCLTVPSPFDFASQGLLYVPPALPLPRDPGFARALAKSIRPLLLANGGRAFLLCTTLRMVRELAAELAAAGDAEDGPLEWLVQGERPRARLLERFRAAARPVLIGSASFWEGVDVVGRQLSLLLIDKLPFAPPEDPVLQGRAQAMRERGEDPFRQMHLPRTAMMLKQGAGRLIRGEQDRGLLVIGDVRLADKAYGRRLLRSLPPFARTRDPEAAAEFVRHMNEGVDEPPDPVGLDSRT
jgi:ATP-dependent DNA helicase DinG